MDKPIGLHDTNDQPINPIFDMLRKEIERQNPGSVEEASAIAAQVRQSYNRTPQEELGGMSPEQVHALTRPGWMEDALVLNGQLSLRDLEGAALFQNARRVLLAIGELTVVRATATGAFNRKFASRMFEEFIIPTRDREFILRYNKVLNQSDVPTLELIRHLLPQAGLLQFRKGEFRLTKRGQALLLDAAVGDLYQRLFRAFFLRINLDALDRLPSAPQVQDTMGFAFYQISRKADDWTALEDIAPQLLLPAVMESLPSASWSRPTSFAELRILRPLRNFGLVEVEQDEPFTSPKRLRKSSIFDRFI